jgi:SAM-dependent methyltransferase
MNNIFDAYAEYYDLLYQEKGYEEEANYVHRLLVKHGVPAQGCLLELGCGTGKHADNFARLGYSVHGVDISPAMVQSANAAKQVDVAEQLQFSVGDARYVRVPRLFDAVVSLFHVTSYQTSNADLIAVFQTAAEHLKPGGVFIFDCWYGPAVLTDRPVVRVKRLHNERVELIRIAEPDMYPNENIVDVNYTVQVKKRGEEQVTSITEKHRIRYLFAPEVELMLNMVGLRQLERLKWLTENSTGFDSWFVLFSAVKGT